MRKHFCTLLPAGNVDFSISLNLYFSFGISWQPQFVYFRQLYQQYLTHGHYKDHVHLLFASSIKFWILQWCLHQTHSPKAWRNRNLKVRSSKMQSFSVTLPSNKKHLNLVGKLRRCCCKSFSKSQKNQGPSLARLGQGPQTCAQRLSVFLPKKTSKAHWLRLPALQKSSKHLASKFRASWIRKTRPS